MLKGENIMGKKKSNMPMYLAVITITAIVAAAGTWMFTQSEYGEGYSAGIAYQQGLDDTNAPASLSTSIASSTFADFASTVAADGSVATALNQNTNLTIENTDDERTASNVEVLLYNPVTNKQGFHDDLEVDTTEYAVKSGGGTFKLFNDGEYITSGFEIGDIGPGGEWILHQIMTLNTASAGTYENGQSYTCHIYVYQSDADYADVVDFTVAT